MNDIAIYARLSMRSEDELSIRRQIEAGTHWAKTHKFNPVEYVEGMGHHSGRSDKSRPKWKELKADLAAGKLAGVWVADLARASRNVREFLDFLDLCDKHQVILISEKEKIDTHTAAGRMLVTVLSALNQWYADDISERQTRAIRHRQAEGSGWGHPPKGLLSQHADGKVVYVPDETQYTHNGATHTYFDTVKRFYELYTEPHARGFDILARLLNQEGYRIKAWGKKPGPLTDSDCYYLSRHTARYRGLLPDDLLDLAARRQAERAGRQSSGGKRKNPPLLLHRLATCPECGHILHGEPAAHGGGRYRHARDGCTAARGVSAPKIDAQVLDWLRRNLVYASQHRETIYAHLAQAPARDAQRTRLQQQAREQLQRELVELARHLAQGRLSESQYDRACAQAQAELDALGESSPEAPPVKLTRELVDFWLSDPVGLIERLRQIDAYEANRLLRDLFERVEIRGQTATPVVRPEMRVLFPRAR